LNEWGTSTFPLFASLLFSWTKSKTDHFTNSNIYKKRNKIQSIKIGDILPLRGWYSHLWMRYSPKELMVIILSSNTKSK
jgi:hypothetical protein